MAEFWHSTKLVTRGKIHLADELPGCIAQQGDKRVGLVTYHPKILFDVEKNFGMVGTNIHLAEILDALVVKFRYYAKQQHSNHQWPRLRFAN